jgi:hypothetical protein
VRHVPRLLLAAAATAAVLAAPAPAHAYCDPASGPACWVECTKTNPPFVDPKDPVGTLRSVFPSCPV